MRLARITLQNFKSFRKVDLPLSKLTLLTGENSSGKSSLIYGYLAVLQSEDFPFQLSVNGTYVNMGDFREMVHQAHQRETAVAKQFAEISVQFIDELSNEFAFDTRWALDRRSSMPKVNTLNVFSKYYDFRVTPSSSDEKYWFSIRHHNQDEYLKSQQFEVGRVIFEMFERFSDAASEKSDDAKKARMAEKYRTLRNIRRLKFSDLAHLRHRLRESDYVHELGSLSDASSILDQVRARFNYIGSYRLQPERAYYRQTRSDIRLGMLGENYVDQILEWENDRAEQLSDLVRALRKTGLLNAVRTKKLRGGRFELRVRPRAKGNWAALTDVGFGISQFLPIVVADFQLGERSTLAVAQPELHLHPSVQAEIADYFITQIKERSKSYILETHSEYLLNRVRLGIVEGKLRPDDVAVYYFENDGEVSSVTKVDFLKDGRIDGAPKGFFETYMMDTMAIAMKAESD